jgi:hypothetical protein
MEKPKYVFEGSGAPEAELKPRPENPVPAVSDDVQNSVAQATSQSFQRWLDERYDDDGNFGGHISERMTRFWRYERR